MDEDNVSLDSVLERALAGSGAGSPEDAVIVALHSSLLSAGFVCVAMGDKGFGDQENRHYPALSTPDRPELPSGWNRTQNVCSLQYQHLHTQHVCLVKALPIGVQLLISAVVACQMDRVFSVALKPARYVKDTTTSYSTPSIYNNLLELMSTLKGEIEVKLTQGCGNSPVQSASGSGRSQMVAGSSPEDFPDHSIPVSEDTQRRSPPIINPLGRLDQQGPGFDDPLRIGPRGPGFDDPQRIGPRGPGFDDPLRIGPPRRPIGDPNPLGEFGPFGYGDRDRLPHGGGSGMIFDPLRQGPGARGGGGYPGVGPRGPHPPSHPPGARYDPVDPFRPRPPAPGRNPQGRFYGPDPDHLPPPGYDDMFS